MEATSTLADALLDDLDDLSDVEESAVEEGKEEVAENGDSSGVDRDQSSKAPSTVTSTQTRYLDSTVLQNHLQTIRSNDNSSLTNKEQEQVEHQLIVQSNKQLALLTDELDRAHGRLSTLYHAKFPELEELLPNPVQYKNAVCCIGNETDLTNVNDALNEFLSNNQIITISVAGSTTSGRLLTRDELTQVQQAAAYMDEILKVQTELTEFVASRMERLAPSVCALVGSTTAAQLVGLAGGLAELAKIPACNLQVLGQTKTSAAARAGLSSVASRPHQGILMQCDLVQTCPRQHQKKALKTVAAKLALAARCDFVNVDTGRPRSAETGLKFRREIEGKIAKWLEPDKAPTLKALPK